MKILYTNFLFSLYIRACPTPTLFFFHYFFRFKNQTNKKFHLLTNANFYFPQRFSRSFTVHQFLLLQIFDDKFAYSLDHVSPFQLHFHFINLCEKIENLLICHSTFHVVPFTCISCWFSFKILQKNSILQFFRDIKFYFISHFTLISFHIT